MNAEERKQKIRAMADDLADRLAAEWPEAGTDVNDLEDFAERLGREVQRQISEETLQEDAARRSGNQSACACGQLALFARMQALPVVTAAGKQRLFRAYYYCDHCRNGHCPADVRLRLGIGNTTPTVQARAAALSGMEPYVQVNDLFHQLGIPIELDIKTLEEVTQAVGHQLAKAERQPFAAAERLVAVGFDGVMVPTPEGNREARVGVIYEPDWEAGRTPMAEAGLRKEYFATTKSRQSLVEALGARAQARSQGTKVAVVCDGGALDWVELDPILPNREEILDLFHVLERVGKIAKHYTPTDEAAATWRQAIKEALLNWGPGKLLQDLRDWQPTCEDALKLKREQLNYFTSQQQRMNYPEYLRRGYPIGSGAVEGACKHVVSDRFRRSGMRWKMATADPVMHVRAALLTQPRIDLRAYAALKPPRVTHPQA